MTGLFNRIAQMQPKHWMLISGYIVSTASVIGGYDNWADLLKPHVLSGLLAQFGILIGSLFVGAPQNPNLGPAENPGRRASDPPPPAA